MIENRCSNAGVFIDFFVDFGIMNILQNKQSGEHYECFSASNQSPLYIGGITAMTIQDSISSLSKNQEVKVCTKCGIEKPATVEFFYKEKRGKYGVYSTCIECRKKYNNLNKNRISEVVRAYNNKKKSAISKQKKAYREKNKESIAKRNKHYAQKNKKAIAKTKREYRCSLCLFSNTMVVKLSVYEDIMEDGNGMLNVRCAYCGSLVIPTILQVQNRILSCESLKSRGSSRIYCNDNDDKCKQSCPTYQQKKYPKGFKKATSREVAPYTRQACFERDNYTCQKCGSTIKESQLHCHHIEGLTQNKMIANDLSNVITYCKQCHISVHKQTGCTNYELRCA